MPLNEHYPFAVSFILTPGTDPDTGALVHKPIGTGFIVSVGSPIMTPNGWFTPTTFLYLVTAAHVVRPYQHADIFVRLRRLDGGVGDERVAAWHFHPTDDVAATPFTCPEQYRCTAIPTENIPQTWTLPDGQVRRPMLGDRVYFIGLLADVPDMVARNIPLVRSATMGAWNQEGVFLGLPDGTRLRMRTAHLIDCHSYKGFSGAPCFLQQDWRYVAGKGKLFDGPMTWLLGLVTGHFDVTVPTPVRGDDGLSIAVPINSGVGVVTPVESIGELLFSEPFTEDRAVRERAFRDRLPPAATAD